ncbi:hypothetical protein BaRGS_00008145, partial [Batillaria attramentaria]
MEVKKMATIKQCYLLLLVAAVLLTIGSITYISGITPNTYSRTPQSKTNVVTFMRVEIGSIVPHHNFHCDHGHAIREIAEL